MIKRLLAHKILDVSKKMPIVGILGPRQSGKTTLAKEIFNQHTYLTLEDPKTREFAENDPREFFRAYKNPYGLILDEVQNVPHLFSYLQVISDEEKHNGYFVLTGSQNYLLLENITQSLAGRIALFNLFPFSTTELANANLLPSTLTELMFKGSYPRIYDQNLSPLEWYPGYITTYLERDIRQIRNITNMKLFQDFLGLCAGRTGQLLNITELSNDCGIGHTTAESWLSLLETSYILFRLQPYHTNFNKRIVKTPKLYFYDTGLACSLLSIQSSQQLTTHYMRGALFESFVISEIMKQYYNSGNIRPHVYFWRDKSGHEIDCLIDKAGMLFPIEIKSGHTLNTDFFDGLMNWNNISGTSPENNSLIYGGDEAQTRSKGSVFGWRHLDAFFKKVKI